MRNYPTGNLKKKRGVDIALHSRPGKAFDWSETAKHSQGELETTRAGLIHTELERIAAYQEKGDLAAAADVRAYLTARRGGHPGTQRGFLLQEESPPTTGRGREPIPHF